MKIDSFLSPSLIRGKGAFLNEKPITVSGVKHLSAALIGTNIGYGRTHSIVDFVTKFFFTLFTQF